MTAESKAAEEAQADSECFIYDIAFLHTLDYLHTYCHRGYCGEARSLERQARGETGTQPEAEELLSWLAQPRQRTLI